mgnify:CR=1 FL=1
MVWSEKNIHFKKYLGYSGENLEATIDLGVCAVLEHLIALDRHQLRGRRLVVSAHFP